MSDYGNFKHGLVRFPLSTGTGNDLLFDADKALFYTLEFFASVLNRHLGGRLMQEVASIGATQIQRPVAETLPINPVPFLHEGQLKFPLLAAYRKSSKTKNIGGQKHSADEIDVCYILPPMQYGEAERLEPILKAVASVIDNRTENGMDPSYAPTGGSAGDLVWETAGVATAEYKGASFGAFAGINDLFFPSVVMQLELVERSEVDTADTDAFAGEHVHVDVVDPQQETTVADFIEYYDYSPPTLTLATPSTGTKQGGTSVTLTGTGFLVGTTPTVYFGGRAATNVVVASTTSITCVTPSHDAFTTFAADVVVTNTDGQSDTLTSGFTFTSP